MVEIFFGIITRQAIRRGTYRSVKDLTTAIETYIDGWNERCQPFTWTKPSTKSSPGQQEVKEHHSRDTSGFDAIDQPFFVAHENDTARSNIDARGAMLQQQATVSVPRPNGT
jgi:hypothetical protein